METDDFDASGLMSKYVRNDLTSEEQLEFEDYLMEHPEMIDLLEADEAIHRWLPEVGLDEEADAKWYSILLGSRLSTGVAACILTLVAVNLIYPNRNDPIVGNPSHYYLAHNAVERTASVRGDSILQVVAHDPDASHFLLTLEHPDPELSGVEVSLKSVPDGSVVKDYAALKLNAEGEANMVLKFSDFPVGRYEIRSNSVDAVGKEFVFYFEIVED